MNHRLYPLVLGIALSSGMTLVATGCNRQEPVPANSSPPPSTTMGTELDDTVVTTKVKSALLGDQNVKGLDIKVQTRKGEVQLSGFVDNQAQIDRAMDITRAVPGVKRVDNGMSVKK